ncbi:Chemotaxis response regulator protein-glutamate methylesterase [Devosia equisanguinis]|uniref:protein-glutamate methylesterase n=1 Tax=Devosia equisanguinis TaxID=2490941 RepID=A0A3S4C939_9HYPH|nr:chemotaxis protein CheB [Devosia equisanguinis]VDS02976.1 Chemotaxis response regulator protein-glutamate methylesterase [Devosia equisanguinis]
MMRPGPQIVVIGASAGAVDALGAILPSIPEDSGLSMLVVVHVPPDKRSVMAELFRAKCRLMVVEAEDKMPIEPGVVYFAPPDYHLQVEADKTLSLSGDEPVLYSRPSIDVLFESAAEALGPLLIGLILTGANQDGANGMAAIVGAGGIGIVQDPRTAFAPAMPEAAIAACPQVRVLALAEISTFLREVEV